MTTATGLSDEFWIEAPNANPQGEGWDELHYPVVCNGKPTNCRRVVRREGDPPRITRRYYQAGDQVLDLFDGGNRPDLVAWFREHVIVIEAVR